MAKQNKQKTQKTSSSSQGQSNQSVDLGEVEVEEESTEKEVIVKSFIPKERKDTSQVLHKGWYNNLHPDAVKHLIPMIEHAYTEIKKRWETEERISKQRKEYLQGLYDKLEDLKIVHAINQKKK